MGYIYCITNLENGKKYIGKTVYSVTKRFQEHCRDCKKERYERRPLYNAMRKYGIDKFTVEELIECDNQELSTYEILYIEKYNSYKNGYNATKGGDGSILYDYNKIINDYISSDTITIKEVAKINKCSIDTVSHILTSCHIRKHIHTQAKPIDQLDVNGNFLQRFESITEAVNWLVDNLYLKTFSKGAKQKLTMCAKGDRKTAYKFKWKFLE